MFQFRKALLDDVPQIAHIHVSSWANAYQSLMSAAYIECHTFSRREALWHKIIFNGLSDVFVAEADSRLHGFFEL